MAAANEVEILAALNAVPNKLSHLSEADLVRIAAKLDFQIVDWCRAFAIPHWSRKRSDWAASSLRYLGQAAKGFPDLEDFSAKLRARVSSLDDKLAPYGKRPKQTKNSNEEADTIADLVGDAFTELTGQRAARISDRSPSETQKTLDALIKKVLAIYSVKQTTSTAQNALRRIKSSRNRVAEST